MTPAIAPPPGFLPPTASVSAVMYAGSYVIDDLVEEAMDYTPVAEGGVRGPQVAEEIWVDDDSGPMGF